MMTRSVMRSVLRLALARSSLPPAMDFDRLFENILHISFHLRRAPGSMKRIAQEPCCRWPDGERFPDMRTLPKGFYWGAEFIPVASLIAHQSYGWHRPPAKRNSDGRRRHAERHASSNTAGAP